MDNPNWLGSNNLWLPIKDGDPIGYQFYKRHYSYHDYKDNRRIVSHNKRMFVGPGEKTVLLTIDYSALFVWRKFIDDSGQVGVNCSIFRNEGKYRSSELIKMACYLAWVRWPGERLYTYVDPTKIKSTNPGYCFIKAGWVRLGEKTKSGKIILFIMPGEY